MLTLMNYIFSLWTMTVITAISTSNFLNVTVTEGFCDSNNSICSEELSEIVNNLYTDVAPCDDFYRYVCKNWEDKKTVPTGFLSWSQNNEAYSKLKEEIYSILETENEYNSTVMQKVVTQYRACMDGNDTREVQLEAIKSYLTTIGGWPLIGQNLSEKYDWMEAIASVTRSIDFINIIIFVSVEKYNSTNSYISLQMPEKRVIWKPYISEMTTNYKFYEYILNTVRKIAPEYSNDKEIKKEIEITADFCRRLLEIMNDHPLEDLQLISVEELQEYTEMDYKKLIQFVLKDVMEVNNETKILVRDMEFLKNVAKVMSEYSNQTHIIANYIGWMAAKELKTELSKKKHAESKRWYCLQHSASYINYPIILSMINSSKREEIVKDVKSITDEIKETIEIDAIENHWMDDESKARFLKKLRTMQVSIIGPSSMNDIQNIELYYEDIGEMTEDNYLQNLIKLYRFSSMKNLMQLSRQLNPEDVWQRKLFTDNIFYSEYYNWIYIPLAILRIPFYHLQFTPSMKFASLGTLIGQGIMHAFDNINMYYDESGKINETLWKSELTREHYDNYMKCLTSYYSNLTRPLCQIEIDGSKTVNENFALNIGVSKAFKAFNHFMNHSHTFNNDADEEKYINAQKLFYISFAYMNCEKVPSADPYNAFLLKYFNKITGKSKVIGAVSNSQQFYNISQCSQHSEMFENTGNMCEAW